jgi:predicted Zn-dependent peptidase
MSIWDISQANVRNEVTSEALNQIIAEINRLRNEIVGEDELQMVKNVVAGNFSRSIENPLTIVKFAFAKKNLNLPSDYFENQIMYIQSVTSDDIIRVANKYLLADSFVTLWLLEVLRSLKNFNLLAKLIYMIIMVRFNKLGNDL